MPGRKTGNDCWIGDVGNLFLICPVGFWRKEFTGEPSFLICQGKIRDRK